MTQRELEEKIGHKLSPKAAVVGYDGGMWRKLGDGSWERYPDYPDPPISKIT